MRAHQAWKSKEDLAKEDFGWWLGQEENGLQEEEIGTQVISFLQCKLLTLQNRLFNIKQAKKLPYAQLIFPVC